MGFIVGDSQALKRLRPYDQEILICRFGNALDYDEMERIAIESKPRMIICGASAQNWSVFAYRYWSSGASRTSCCRCATPTSSAAASRTRG